MPVYAPNGQKLVFSPSKKNESSVRPASRGLSFSDFMVQHADKAAIRTIQQHTTWTLENEERDFFVEALLHPPEPGTRLKSAAERYRKRARG